MAETPGLIEQYAQHLERKASALVVRFTVSICFVGAALGAFPLVRASNSVVPSHLGFATLLLGAIAGAYVGYTMGERRAVEPRLQAQLALRQLRVEERLFTRVGQAPAPVPGAAPVPVA